jgi:hypothetical protein
MTLYKLYYNRLLSKKKKKKKIENNELAPVAHTCNPSYSGNRDQEIVVQSQPRQIVHETLSWRKHIKKKKKEAGKVAQGVGPEFKSQHWKKI